MLRDLSDERNVLRRRRSRIDRLRLYIIETKGPMGSHGSKSSRF